MKAALKILGHKNVYHAYEIYTYPEHAWSWLAAWRAKARPSSSPPFTASDWDKLLGPYSAITDMPAVCFAPELIEQYPEAKIILVEREIESWYKSFNKGVIETTWDTFAVTRVLSVLEPQLVRPIHQLWWDLLGRKDGYFGAESLQEMQASAR